MISNGGERERIGKKEGVVKIGSRKPDKKIQIEKMDRIDKKRDRKQIEKIEQIEKTWKKRNRYKKTDGKRWIDKKDGEFKNR